MPVLAGIQKNLFLVADAPAQVVDGVGLDADQLTAREGAAVEDVIALSLREFSDWYNEHDRTEPGGAYRERRGKTSIHAPKPPKDVRFVQRWDGLLEDFMSDDEAERDEVSTASRQCALAAQGQGCLEGI